MSNYFADCNWYLFEEAHYRYSLFNRVDKAGSIYYRVRNTLQLITTALLPYSVWLHSWLDEPLQSSKAIRRALLYDIILDERDSLFSFWWARYSEIKFGLGLAKDTYLGFEPGLAKIFLRKKGNKYLVVVKWIYWQEECKKERSKESPASMRQT